MTEINDRQTREIEHFVKEMAPGVKASFEQVDMFDTFVVRLGLKIEATRAISNQSIIASEGRIVGEEVMTQVAELQKEAVKSIGLEAYVREREVAVLEIAKERLTKFVTEALSMSPDLAEGVVTDLVNDIRNDLGAP